MAHRSLSAEPPLTAPPAPSSSPSFGLRSRRWQAAPSPSLHPESGESRWGRCRDEPSPHTAGSECSCCSTSCPLSDELRALQVSSASGVLGSRCWSGSRADTADISLSLGFVSLSFLFLVMGWTPAEPMQSFASSKCWSISSVASRKCGGTNGVSL